MYRNVKGKELYCFISGLCKIIDGLVRVLTLGYYSTRFEFKYVKNNLK